MSASNGWCLLEDLGLLRIAGADACAFLQGQLSNDVSRLSAAQLQRAGLHSPQGRTLALLWLLPGPELTIDAVLPRELLPNIEARLRRYVLRAKVSIRDHSAQHRIYGWLGAAPTPSHAYDATRALQIAGADAPAPPGASITREYWRALDIAAGLPQIHPATSGLFVAQMLNLDCIDAISFSKGCYTGQEVIARAHYRGRVKRRMQRFVSHEPLRLHAGDAAVLEDGRSLRVVEATTMADGRCEFLAVAARLAGTDAAETEAPPATTPIRCSPLPLPYPLPE